MWENLIDWQARRGPERAAIRTNDGVITYGVFAGHIARITGALERENLPPGVVLIATPQPALQWLLTFALERLGRVTICELQAVEETARLVGAAAVIAMDQTFQIEGVRALDVDADWRRKALAGPPSARRSGGEATDIVRIILSSGTTGQRKQVPIRRSVIDARLGRPVSGFPAAKIRSLQAMGMETSGGFQQPLITWLHGGELVAPQTTNAATLRQYRPNWMPASPIHIQRLLPLLSELYSETDPLGVIVGGAAIPPPLVESLTGAVGIDATTAYGSTEAGTSANGPVALTKGRPGAVGHLTPWNTLEVVDEDDRVLPPGRSGVIRIRGPGVVEGYLEEGVITPFKDGWFYPNDLGHVDADGVLVIDGRVDDVINIGGLKLSSTRVEETLLVCKGVGDAAVTVFPVSDGRWVMHAAVVATEGYDPEALKTAVVNAYSADVVLVEIEAIPRNGMGKIIREAVRQAILAKRTGR